MEQLVDIVGVNIREIRKQKKLTQEELAEKCELQTSYLAGVERGDRNITLQTLEKIADGLEVNAKQLLELESPLNKISLEKTDLLQIFTGYLEDKSEKEIKLIIDIARSVFETYK